MIKLLIGGSPCTKWSIAQRKDREVTASGEGWELFLNYKIAKEKFKPDFFLYENNKSVAQAIKNQISMVLGVPIMHINSALVSAQNRQRFYAFNWTVPQPEDRSILLKDILETGQADRDKSYCLTHQSGNVRDYVKKHQTQVAFEPIRVGGLPRPNGEISQSQGLRIYSPDGKAVSLKANAGGAGGKTGLYAIPYTANSGGSGGSGQGLYATPAEDNSPYSGKNIYEVKDGLIEIKGVKYKIKLPDGFYIIRKLTVTECCRLQTLPDDYCRAVSDSRAYKGLGGAGRQRSSYISCGAHSKMCQRTKKSLSFPCMTASGRADTVSTRWASRTSNTTPMRLTHTPSRYRVAITPTSFNSEMRSTSAERIGRYRERRTLLWGSRHRL